MKPYTQEEKEWITNNYSKLSLKEMAFKLDRTVNSLKESLSSWGIAKRPRIKWTPELLKFIKDSVGVTSYAEMSERTGIKPFTLRKKALQLGVGCIKCRYTDEEKAYIREHYGKISNAELAERLGRPANSQLWAIARDMGLTKKRSKIQ